MNKSNISFGIIKGQEIDEILHLWREEDLAFDKTKYNQLVKKYLSEPDSPVKKFLEYLTPQNKEPLPIRNVFKIIRERYHGFCLVEYPYMDNEFWDSYVGFYAGSFSPMERECERLHFFKGDENRGTELIQGLTSGSINTDIEKLPFKYLGYCVLRPIKSHVVGRTAIQFDDEPLSDGKPILTAKQTCAATLLAARFEVESPEFIQQDPQLGQCATASLWVTGNIASKRFGVRQQTFSTITKHAVGNKLPNIPAAYAVVDPDSGLSPTEIKSALAASGMMYLCATQKIGAVEGTNLGTCIRLGHFVYSFVESGLPVILCLDSPDEPIGHAVAAVGHFLPFNVTKKDIASVFDATGNRFHKRHMVVSSAIKVYYAHDDCYGPFNRVTFKIPKDKKPPIKCLCQRLNFWNMIPEPPSLPPGLQVNLGRLDRADVEYRLKEAIVPVHFRIHNDSWDSLLIAINKFEGFWEEKNLGTDTIFLWRSFLTSGSDFKRSIVTKGKRKYSSVLLNKYAVLHMPKYIWVHEFTKTTKNAIGTCFPSSNIARMIDGEILVDATSPTNDIRIIAARFAKSLWTPDGKVTHDADADRFQCFERL